MVSSEVTRRYTKSQILEYYLNTVYYGNLAYGIEAASNVYFDTHAKNLTLAQASLLAGLPQQPNVYDPINYLEGGALKGIELRNGWLSPDYRFPSGTPPPKIRQAAVLTQMVDEGYVTESQARAAAAEDLRFSSQVVPLNAPHFVFDLSGSRGEMSLRTTDLHRVSLCAAAVAVVIAALLPAAMPSPDR